VLPAPVSVVSCFCADAAPAAQNAATTAAMKKIPFFGMCLFSSFVVTVNVRVRSRAVGYTFVTDW
jgi:HSP90 family molecular chaperone